MAATNLPVLVYDGDCGICTSSAKWVIDHLPDGSGTAVEPWQSLDLDELGLTQKDVTEAAWWVEPGGRRLRGHNAIAASLKRIGGAWGVLGRAITLPGVSLFSALVYSLVAKYRYKLPGSTDACRLPADR